MRRGLAALAEGLHTAAGRPGLVVLLWLSSLPLVWLPSEHPGAIPAAALTDPLLCGVALAACPGAPPGDGGRLPLVPGIVWTIALLAVWGGLLAELRGGSGAPRGLLLGIRFHSGRMLRLGGLAAAAWAALALGIRAGGLGGTASWPVLLLVALASSWTRVILVMEERRSALLAACSALGVWVRHPVAVGILAVGALLPASAAIAAWPAAAGEGPALASRAAQALLAAALLLAHAAGQVALHRSLGSTPRR